MKIYTFNYKTQSTQTVQPNEILVAVLTGNTRNLIVYDTENKIGSFCMPQPNAAFGINYGQDCKKGFAHENVEYYIDASKKLIKKSKPYENKFNLFFDASKRSSFEQFKIEFKTIDEVLDEFKKQDFRVE